MKILRLKTIFREVSNFNVETGMKYRALFSKKPLIVQYNGKSLVYHTINGDTETRDLVQLEDDVFKGFFILMPYVYTQEYADIDVENHERILKLVREELKKKAEIEEQRMIEIRKRIKRIEEEDIENNERALKLLREELKKKAEIEEQRMIETKKRIKRIEEERIEEERIEREK